MIVSLRRLVPGDLGALHEWLSDRTVVQYMLIPVSVSVANTETFLASSMNDGPCQGQWWTSAVRGVLVGGVLAGLCGIVVQAGSEEGEIWYLIGPKWQGCGAATLAALQMLAYGFDVLRLHRVFGCCVPENRASARVLMKSGMRLEGLRRKNLKIHGEWQDSELYAILEEEWQARGAPDNPTPSRCALQKTSLSAN